MFVVKGHVGCLNDLEIRGEESFRLLDTVESEPRPEAKGVAQYGLEVATKLQCTFVKRLIGTSRVCPE